MISGCSSNCGSAECCKVQECAGLAPPPPDIPDCLPDMTEATGQQAYTAAISPFQISPNPSITPFMSGKSILVDSEETKDQKRALTGSVLSNTASVIELVVPWLAARLAFLVAVVVAGDAREGCCSGE